MVLLLRGVVAIVGDCILTYSRRILSLDLPIYRSMLHRLSSTKVCPSSLTTCLKLLGVLFMNLVFLPN